LTVVPLVREADRQDILPIPQVTRRVQKAGQRHVPRERGDRPKPQFFEKALEFARTFVLQYHHEEFENEEKKAGGNATDRARELVIETGALV